MKNNYLWGGIITVVLILGVIFPRSGGSVIERVIEKVGGTPGTTVSSETFSIGGRNFAKIGRNLTATSSVVCSIKNPFGTATTSIETLGVHFESSFAAATEFTISTSTTAFASTSNPLVAPIAIGASEKLTKIYKGTKDIFLAKNEYLNVRVATTTGGSEIPTGTCTFEGTKI